MNFLLRPIAFLLIILLGCVLMQRGFFQPGHQRLLSKIVMNITLPCAAVKAFGGVERTPTLLLLILLGLLGSLLPMLLVFLCTRRLEQKRRVFYMLNNSGNNLGSFSLPIVQNFFGAAGGVVLCIFDIGNAIISVGTNYTLTASLLHTDGGDARVTPRILAKRFFGSIPLDVYLVMLVLMLLNIPVPAPVLELIDPLAAANPFLVMLMLGAMFQPRDWRRCLPETLRLVLIRLVFAAALSLVFFYLTPFPLEIRRVLAVLPFAPASVMAVIFTEKCGGDTALSSFANSVTVILSLVIMSTLSLYLMA